MPAQLKSLQSFRGRPGPLLLIILDGVGIGKRDDSDGVYLAKTPCLDALMKEELYTTLKAHGTAVGMPTDEDMGNSEVGHNALGAGRIFAQGASLVNNAINDESIYAAPVWKNLAAKAKTEGRTFHFIGLLSDGNVHSHINHLLAMTEHCAKEGVKRIRVHVLLDGRDVFERSALHYIEKFEGHAEVLKDKYSCDCRIASGGGRMIVTMDRYNADWDIVKKGWDAHVLGEAQKYASASEAVQSMYDADEKVNDQYLDSFVVAKDDSPIGTIENGDAVVFFNFRGDRAIELSMAFDQGDEFDKFDRKRVPDVFFAGMMEYDGDLHVPKHFLVNPPKIDNAVSVYMCRQKIKTFAISETQKYGHVTYFWNGNKSGYVDESLETYVEIPSDKIQYDKAPKMKAYEITEKTIELLKSGQYKFGRINFPNGDMVGHTGVPEAIIASVEAVDECLGKLLDTVKQINGMAVVLADHGNADEMYTMKNGKKSVSTAHSLNPVPFAIVDSGYQGEYNIAQLESKGLANVAATLLNLLGFESPEQYEPSLINFNF